MIEELERKLAKDALETASPEMTTNVLEGDETDLKQVVSQVIEETVQVHNPELEKLQEFKARLQRIKDRREKVEKKIENKDLDLWIFQQRLDEFDDDLNPDRISKTSIESQLEDVEDWLNESISQPQDDESEQEEPPVRGWPDSVDESLTEFEERLDEFESRLSSPNGWFDEYHEHLDGLSRQLDNPDGYVGGLRQDVNEFVQCLNNPENISNSIHYDPSINEFIQNASEELRSVHSEYERVKTELKPYKQQYQSFESYFDGYGDELDRIQDRLADYEATLENIQSDLDSAEQIVDGFGTSVSVFRVRVQELEEEMDSLEETIDSKELRSGVSESQIDNIEERRKELFHLATDSDQLRRFGSRLEDYEDRIQYIYDNYYELEEPTEEERQRWEESQVDYCIMSDTSSAYSIKPTNIELDIKSAIQVVGSSAVVSGTTAALSKAGTVLLLCAAIYGDIKTEVKVEDAFVYWVGYKNRQPRWELRKDELPELVEEEKANVDFEISIEDDEVFEAVKRLKRKGCLDEVEKGGEAYIVFRETCRVEWE